MMRLTRAGTREGLLEAQLEFNELDLKLDGPVEKVSLEQEKGRDYALLMLTEPVHSSQERGFYLAENYEQLTPEQEIRRLWQWVNDKEIGQWTPLPWGLTHGTVNIVAVLPGNIRDKGTYSIADVLVTVQTRRKGHANEHELWQYAKPRSGEQLWQLRKRMTEAIYIGLNMRRDGTDLDDDVKRLLEYEATMTGLAHRAKPQKLDIYKEGEFTFYGLQHRLFCKERSKVLDAIDLYIAKSLYSDDMASQLSEKNLLLKDIITEQS